jgi:NitT/TauT family transport system substrate-binding protein
MSAGYGISRRNSLLGLFTGLVGSTAAGAALGGSVVRLGVLQFGTVQWVADVMQRHALDQQHGFMLRTVTLANTDAGRVALMAGAADVVVSDWFFVANQRVAGTKLVFAPFSSSTGGVMVPAQSSIRSLDDLRGRRLGVAGGPLDKSWLVVRAAARRLAGIDLVTAAAPVYAAPPLLGAKLAQGELDAALTYWNFAAQLEVAGCREIISVADCARALGLASPFAMVGFVFRQDWADQNIGQANGFLAAAAAAESILAQSGAEWERIRPLMRAEDEGLFQNLRRRFLDGVAPISATEEQQAATQLFEVLLHTGGTAATGGLERLPEGVFWQTPYG